MCTGLALALTYACYLFHCRASGLVRERLKPAITVRVRHWREDPSLLSEAHLVNETVRVVGIL